MRLGRLKRLFVAAPRFGALTWREADADAPLPSLVAAWRRHALTPPFHARSLADAIDATLEDLCGFRVRRGEGVWWVAPAQLPQLEALGRVVADFPPAKLEVLHLTDDDETRHTLGTVVKRSLDETLTACRDQAEALLARRGEKPARLVRAAEELQRLQRRADLARLHFALDLDVAHLVASLTARLEAALTARVVA